MDAASIALRRMSAAELDAFLEALLPVYAAERAAADHVPLAVATERAHEQVRRLLPRHGALGGHHFAAVVAGTETVGGVWYHLDGRSGDAFVYNLTVLASHRRRGYASAALALVEAEARAAGCATLALNVFAPNAGAIELYRRAGFGVASHHMNKKL